MKRPLFLAAVVSVIAAVIFLYSSAIIIVAVTFFISLITVVYLKLSKLSYFYLIILLIIPVLYISYISSGSAKDGNDYQNDYQNTYQVDSFFYVTRIIEKQGYSVAILKNKKDITVGEVLAESENYNPEAYNSETNNSAGGKVCRIRIYMSCSDGEFLPGDVIYVKGEIENFSSPTNEGEFDQNMYYRSLGIFYKCKADEQYLVKRNEDSLQVRLYRLKQRISDVFKNVFGETEASLVEAMVLGDKSDIDEEINNNFKNSGIAHLLAVSGLHMSLVGMALYNLLKKFFHRVPAALISIPIMVMYLLITGNGISARRAAIMLLCTIVADVLGRSYDTLSALSLCCIIMVIENVYVIENTGFQMSFCAIAGLVLLYPVINNQEYYMFLFRKNNGQDRGKPVDFGIKLWKKAGLISGDKGGIKSGNKSVSKRGLTWRFLDTIAMSLSIQLATLPVVLYSTYQISVISIILNLIVIPLAAVVMISGILTGLIGLLSMNAAVFAAGGANYVLKLYEMLTEISVKLDNSVVVTGKPDIKSVTFYVAVVLGITAFYNLLIHKKDILTEKGRKTFFGISFILLCFSIYGMQYKSFDGLTVKMLDVGQGDSIFVRTEEGTTLLFDGGSSDVSKVGKYRIYPFLKSVKTKNLDYVVISHCDEDHINGIVELMDMCDNTFSIGHIVMPDLGINMSDKKNSITEAYINLIKCAEQRGIKVIYLKAGDVLLDSETFIKCVHPCDGYRYNSSNDYSAVYYLKYGDFSMLFTGDAEKKAEECLLENCGTGLGGTSLDSLTDCTVLKCGHHGSKTSTSEKFLQNINPKIALISSGAGNSYGHPHIETLERLEAAGTKVLRTDTSGEITIQVKKSKMWIEEYLG